MGRSGARAPQQHGRARVVEREELIHHELEKLRAHAQVNDGLVLQYLL